MTPVFADTFFFLALINPKDAAHRAAIGFSESRTGPLLTTAWVLTELADGVAPTRDRHLFAAILGDLSRDPKDIVIPATRELFDRGAQLYVTRSDKQWSLTDCISFIVMRDHGLTEALTGDHHFEQAGFVALLK